MYPTEYSSIPKLRSTVIPEICIRTSRELLLYAFAPATFRRKWGHILGVMQLVCAVNRCVDFNWVIRPSVSKIAEHCIDSLFGGDHVTK